MTATIPTLRVKTAHSMYFINQTTGQYARVAIHADANRDVGYGVGSAGEWRDYDKIVSSLEPGNRLVITHGDGSWVRSTEIQEIEEL